MKDYVNASLETHLFFARIMKEHALFLQAGFVCKDKKWIQRADFFRRQFEELLAQTVQMSNRMVSKSVLQSGELVTCYTMDAEKRTSQLSGIPINMRITQAQEKLECKCKDYQERREHIERVQWLNERAIWLLNGLIEFKETILRQVRECRMYTANYDLMIEHMKREANLYRDTIQNRMGTLNSCKIQLPKQEEFWNCIMMEHAMFTRGLLDPSEPELIVTANDFVNEFRGFLDEKEPYGKDFKQKTLEATMQLRDFNAMGTDGILGGKIRSIILPLLSDHVLREANYYVRIQKKDDIPGMNAREK